MNVKIVVLQQACSSLRHIESIHVDLDKLEEGPKVKMVFS